MRSCIIFLCIFLGFVAQAFSKNLFVGIGGADTNPGTLELPFETLQYGASHLTPGDTLFILEGNYRQSLKKNYLNSVINKFNQVGLKAVIPYGFVGNAPYSP